MSSAPLIQNVWSFATVLRNDGIDYGDYLEKLPEPQVIAAGIVEYPGSALEGFREITEELETK